MNDQYNHELIKNIKECFTRGESIRSEQIRSVIYESWVRSEKNGINYQLTYFSEFPVKNVTQVPNKWMFEWEVYLKNLQKLYSELENTNSVLFLVDINLNIWLQGGNAHHLKILNSKRLGIGSNLAESLVGTNAVALAERDNCAQYVIGAEHYLELLADYASFACPTYNGKNDRILGYIMILTTRDKYSPFILPMLEYYAKMTRLTISKLCTCSELFMIEELSSLGFNQSHGGLILLDHNGIIMKLNQRVLQFFNVDEKEILGCHFGVWFPELNNFKDSIQEGKPISLHKIKLDKLNNQSLFLESQPLKKDGFFIGTIIKLYTQQRKHQIAKELPKSNVFFTFDDIIGSNPGFTKLKEVAKEAALSESNILIIGESGTGKELFAQAIHNASKKKNGPFIAINCAAIPKDLIGSELFGYVEGAFTGARKGGAPGKFELADKGTIFLDEIGEMSIDMQSVLLRVLEEKRVTRLGGGKNSKQIDVRIIAASNKNLRESVQSMEFRLDLFYRLNVIELELISLRERRDDIPLLTNYYLEKFNISLGKNIKGCTPEVLAILEKFIWPGNVRQLRNVVERGLNKCNSNYLTINDLPKELLTSSESIQSQINKLAEYEKNVIAEFSYKINERSYIEDLMKKYKSNKSRVAKELGISRVTLYKKIRQMNKENKEF